MAEHGLSDRAQVIEAPLAPLEIYQETHKWYTLTDLRLDEPIDFLFVDGPAKILGNIIRYPAIPVLGQHLADKAFIILDDTHREQERLIVQRWLDENPEIRVVDSERCRNSGFAILLYSRLRNNS
ncbi:MAG: class I SAM-dependent methyltransferase [Anaerolineae bacterium]|nr:class I SAM-dependent methyltransferase [Anaerolineae bacterium]